MLRGTQSPTGREPTPKPCPEKPQLLTVDNVGGYIVDFEEAYAWNDALAQHDTVANIDQHIADVPEVDNGEDEFLVYLDDVFLSVTTDEGIGDETYSVNYYVTDSRTMRAQSSEQERIDPRSEGNRVSCPPDR